MVQRFENKGSRGFSLVETLAVVAILVILLSLSAVAAAYYRDYLKITELDNAARDIYMAAENRAVLLGGSGQLEKALTSGGAQTLAEGGEQQASVYVAKDTAASLGLLTGGAIDPALLNGQFYIVYDTASGAVTDVFYTEGPDIQDIHYALSIAGNRDKRMRPDSGPMLGYYGGEQEARTPYTPLPAPEVLVEVENGDLLKVHVTFSVPDAALSIVGNNWMHTAKQTVQLEYEGAAIPLMNYPTLFFPERHSSSVSGAAVTHTWVLDALDRADGVSGRHFYQLFSNSRMTFGGDFTVTAEIELSAPGCRPTSASGSDTGNSLFAQRSGGSAAQLENLRHLQNLDAATSRAGGKTSAVQINDIDCRGTTIKDPLDPYGLYKFASIENPELTSFDAGWTLQDGANRRNEITDLRVTKDSAKVTGAGLFAKTAVGMTFTGVRLMDAGVTGSQDTAAAGALVGSAGSGSTFRDIRAVNVKAVCPNGPAGGIAGSVAGSSGKQNENLFSDCRVYWEPEEGQDNLRSLLGSDQKSNPYQYGEILHGTNAGGLAGELSGKSGTDDVPYRLDVTVHVTASAELRPSRLFMFPNDTVSIAVRATDKAGHPLDERLQNGKLTLKGDPNCGSSGYLTGKTLIQEATEDGGLPTVQFTTAIPGDAPELEAPLTLGANTDFAYTVTTPDPDSPGDPSKATVQDYGGGNGGDVRVEIIQPWKDREDFIRFEETQSPDGTPQIVCTVTFPDSYPVDAEGTLHFAAAGSPTVAPMFNQPTAAWRDEAGSISFSMTIRMRIDGALRAIIPVPRELQSSVISRLKIMARMDIAQKLIPQDGRANVTVRHESLDLRISNLPTIHGEKVVIRLLRKTPELATLEGIGLEGDNRERFCRLVDNATEGVILMVGPTGSGKTSTLYAMIDRLKSEEVNLVSLEDPVEYHIDGICQVQINDKTGLTFASVLRSVLRQDPDIIAVGEIRDGETAEIAMRAAMTGHLVLSTIHTNNAVSSIDRLLDIGVEPYLIAGAVKGIVSQRLLRKVCPHCKKPYTPSAEEREALGLPPGEYTFYRGAGCGECFGTGYRGRTGVFEILPVNPAIRRAIHSRSLKDLEAAMDQADFHPIMENCRKLVLDGVTSSEEVHRVLGGG